MSGTVGTVDLAPTPGGVEGALTGYLPALLMALAVLVVGWLASLWIASLVRAGLARTDLDNDVAAFVSEDGPPAPRGVEVLAGRGVFWLLMIGVAVVFFHVLGWSQVSTPLRGFVGELVAYLPSLLGALGLVLLAWVVATLLRFAVRQGLQWIRFDERVGGGTDGPSGEASELIAADRLPSRHVAETLYWLVFLLFLPAVLAALQLTDLLGPIRSLFSAVAAHVPNLLAALLMLAVGWLVARIAQKLTTNLARAMGADRLGSRGARGEAGAGVLGRDTTSSLIGLVVYVLVLVPVLIASLDALGLEVVTQPAAEMLGRFLVAVPRLFAAALVIGLAYVVGRLVASLAASLLAAAGFDRFVARLGLLQPASARAAHEGGAGEPRVESLGARRRPSELVGYAVLVAMMLFAAIEALSLLQFEMLAAMLTEVSWFLADVGLGLVIFAAGVYFAGLAARAIRASGAEHATLFAAVAEGAIRVLAVALALRQIGLPEDLINLAFGLLLGAVAIAGAIAFGWGGRGIAARYLEKWVGELEKGDDKAE